MKKINRKQLLKVLNQLKPGLSEKETTDQSDSFVFDKGRVYTYNDEVCMSTPTEVEHTISVQNKELISILGKLKGELIQVEPRKSESDENDKPKMELFIKDGKAKAGVTANFEITMPLREIQGNKKWNPLPEDFLKGVKRCVASSSKDMSKPVLTCVHVIGYLVEACDMYRVTRYKMSKKINQELLLPSDIIKQLTNYNFTKYATSTGWIHFKDEEDMQFSCRTFKAKYPNLNDMVAKEEDSFKMTLPEELSLILEKASVFSESQFEDDNLVEVTIDGKKMVIRGESSSGWFEEKSVIKTKVDKNIEFQINPHDLIYLLKLEKEVEVSERKIIFSSGPITHALVI